MKNSRSSRGRGGRGGRGKQVVMTHPKDGTGGNNGTFNITNSSFSRTRMANAKGFGGDQRQYQVQQQQHQQQQKSSAAAYAAATELLRNLTDRRQLFDKGANVAQEMHDRVRAICEAEEAKKIRLFLPTGNDMDDEEENLEKLQEDIDEASQKILSSSINQEPKSAAQSRSLFEQDHEEPLDLPVAGAGNQDGINLKQLCEEEVLEAQIVAKQDKLEQLRSFQRAMAEIMDQFEEERSSREKLLAMGQQDATSDEYEKKARQRADRVKEAMRSNFETLIADNEEIEIPPDAANAFSIQNMSTGMELLGKSIATIAEATDEICVTSTFKTEGEPASIFLCAKALRTHVPYSKKTHELILGHLTHYELGEQAILEGGDTEINRLRESFLQCKDRLILEEQRLKAAEEHRDSLRKRLLSIHQRCDMWEIVLLQRDCPRMYLELVQQRKENTPSPDASHAGSSHNSHGSAPSRKATDAVEPSGVPEPSRPGSGEVRVTSPFLSLMPTQETLASRNTHLDRRRFTRVASTVDTALEDLYETQVANSWGNPYVQKARQYEQALQNRLHSTLSVTNKTHTTSTSATLGTISSETISETNPSSPVPRSKKEEAEKIGVRALTAEDEEAVTTSYARRLALLQSLSRTIPASTFIAPEATKALHSTSSLEHSRSKTSTNNNSTRNEADEQLRKETRLSIQRLIRYTAQHLQSRTKDV